MEIWRIVLGFFVSTIVGAIVLWIFIDILLWRYISEKHNIEIKKTGSLTVALGIFERASYTAALIMGFPQWIAVWLALKVAVGWNTNQTRKGPSDNLYLIGCVISIMFGVIGAWIVMGQLPS